MGIEVVDGPRAWDFLYAFFASRRAFHAVYQRYEARVLRFAREAGVHRDDLRLPPENLARLFHLPRLHHLRDDLVAPLRELAHGLFREVGVVEPLDTTCSHIFHEASILMEEHQSVVRFQHLSDPRRYAQVFEEVSGYYPTRLRRIRRSSRTRGCRAARRSQDGAGGAPSAREKRARSGANRRSREPARPTSNAR